MLALCRIRPVMEQRTEHISLPGKGVVLPKEWYDWRWQWKNRIQRLEQLAAFGAYPSFAYQGLVNTYPFGITPYYLSLIDRDDENDPLRKQCFPDLKEVDYSLGGVCDPLQEEGSMPVPGVVRRYPDRCLTLVTNSCVTYCRHCNRKRRWREKASGATKEELQIMLDYIAQQAGIREVIVSGGDPLTLNEGLLDWFLGSLRAIPHVEVLRLGSRIPAVLPMRITKGLCRMLARHRPLWFNTQFNHVREITADAALACEMLLTSGIPLANQSVLLKGVNDSVETMRSLLYGLQRIGVKPYYLFQCEPVAGTDHFRVDLEQGREIMATLRRTISGLCLPLYVLDTPGEGGKVPLEQVVRKS